MPRLLFIFVLLWLPMVSAGIGAQSRYEVTAGTLNVRTGPSEYYPVAYKLHKGDEVVVLEQNGQWATIQRDGTRYYANNRYLKYIGLVPQKRQATPKSETTWDKLFDIVRIILWILFGVVVIGGFIGFETVAGLALWARRLIQC